MEEIKIDRRQIVVSAIDILQEHGIVGFSMRKLAARLEIRAPTLYWYFPDRASILRAIIKTLLTESIDAVGCQASWQDWFQKFGETLWHANLETPFATMLIQSAELNNDEIFDATVELIDRNLKSFDLPRETYIRVHTDIQALVVGWAVLQHSGVAGRLQRLVDVDSAVRDGIRGIIEIWTLRFAQSD